MMITQLRVQNYKALRDVTLDLTPLHVLIGPNDSGKSSALEAAAALSRAMDRSLEQAFVGSWTGRQLVWRGDADLPVVLTARMNDDEGDLTYSLAVRFMEAGRDVRRTHEELTAPPASKPTSLPPQNHLWSTLARLDEGRGLPEPDRALARRARDLLRGVQLYRWNPSFLSLPAAPDSNRQFQMDPSGFGLSLVLDDLLGYDRDRFIALETRFRQIFPDVKSIKLVREMAYRAPADASRSVPLLQQSEGKGLQFEFAKSGRVLPASQVSDGVLLVLAYLTVLHLPEPPRLLLVEEPENGIHPKRLADVVGLLRTLVTEHSRTQVLMTTHSPYVVDLFSPDEVTLCRRAADGATELHRLSTSTTVREQLDVFSLGEIWTAEGEDRLVRSATTVGEGRE